MIYTCLNTMSKSDRGSHQKLIWILRLFPLFPQIIFFIPCDSKSFLVSLFQCVCVKAFITRTATDYPNEILPYTTNTTRNGFAINRLFPLVCHQLPSIFNSVKVIITLIHTGMHGLCIREKREAKNLCGVEDGQAHMTSPFRYTTWSIRWWDPKWLPSC